MVTCGHPHHMMIWLSVLNTGGVCIAGHTRKPGMASKQEVYEDLQHRIIINEIGPGVKLNEKGLMGHYDIGRTPLREIFRELQRDGLIEIIPKLGTRVISSDIHELKKTVQVRRRLEGLVGQLAVENITKEQLTALQKMVRKSQELDPDDDGSLETLTRYDVEIHEVLYASTHNEVLSGIISQLQKRMSKFWHQMGFTFEEFVDEIEDFINVLNAIEEKDAGKATKALETHMDRFVKKVKDRIL